MYFPRYLMPPLQPSPYKNVIWSSDSVHKAEGPCVSAAEKPCNGSFG